MSCCFAPRIYGRDRAGSRWPWRATQLRQAIALDPTNVEVHAKLANLHYLEWEFWWVKDRPGTLRAAYDLATKAVHLDERSSHCRWVLAIVQMARGEFEQARVNIDKAIDLNPNDARARVIYGWYLTAVGQPERAIEEIEQARRYDPLEEDWMPWLRGIACYTAQRYEEAVAAFSAVNDPFNEITGWLAASLAQAGRIEEAQSTLQTFLEVARNDMVGCPGRSDAELDRVLARRHPVSRCERFRPRARRPDQGRDARLILSEAS